MEVLVDDAARDFERVLRTVLTLTPLSGWTAVVGVLGLVAGLLLWRPLVRVTGWASWATLASVVLVAGTLTVTLTPGSAAGPQGVRSCVRQAGEVDTQVMSIVSSADALLNLVLLVPLGFALVLATRRVWPAAFVVLALPGVIELTQTRVTGRVCSGVDYLTNATGGLAGLLAGAVVLTVARALRRVRS